LGENKYEEKGGEYKKGKKKANGMEWGRGAVIWFMQCWMFLLFVLFNFIFFVAFFVCFL
jgi:hypothetical protein